MTPRRRSGSLVRVELEPPVGVFIECVLEFGAGDEADGGRRLACECGIDAARRSELGADTAAVEDAVPGGRRAGGDGVGMLVASHARLVGGLLDCVSGVTAGGEPDDETLRGDDVVERVL